MDAAKALATLKLQGDTVVIDIKPYSEKYVTLFELLKVFGVSSHGWTPIMLEMRELIVDEPWEDRRKEHFVIPKYDRKDIVHEFLYLNGTIKDGMPVDGWGFPPPSSTNATLLWLDVMKHFMSKAHVS